MYNMPSIRLLLTVTSFLVVVVPVALSSRFSSSSNRGDSTGLCPSSYPKLVMDYTSGRCFETGSQGFCGRLSVIASNPFNPNYAVCRCKENYLNSRNTCFGRPLVSYGRRCYFEYSQGPCKKGQWLIRDQAGNPQCRKTPCPILESQRDLFYADFPQSDFYFTMDDTSSECFKTGTQSFCKPGERVYFLGTDPNPHCLSYDPANCDADFSSNNGELGLVGFGVPYDGI